MDANWLEALVSVSCILVALIFIAFVVLATVYMIKYRRPTIQRGGVKVQARIVRSPYLHEPPEKYRIDKSPD